MQLPDDQVSLYAIVVLYRMAPADSPTYRTLLRSLAELTPGALRYRVLLYDNTPSGHAPTQLPEGVEYFASPANRGLAEAYNYATARAREQGFGWLLTLDQDTELPSAFIPEMAQVAGMVSGREEIAAIVPHIHSGERDVSPSWFAWGVLPRYFAAGYRGVPKLPVYAFNSGTLVRVSAVDAIGGYNPLFWLDCCDNFLYRRLERAGKKVFVAGQIQLRHDFSLFDISGKMSLFRYQNAVEAGSAFYDLEMGRLAGLEHTARLLWRYFKQRRRHVDKAICDITGATARQRLVTPKRRRIQVWVEKQRQRIERENELSAAPQKTKPA